MTTQGYTLEENEKLTPCMAYMPMRLVWGKLLTKKGIRVHTWLKMKMVPIHFTFLDAQMLVFSGATPTCLTFNEIYVPVSDVLAYHVLPPATENIELDYDPDEPNRKMQPVTAMINVFRFDGCKRISSLGNFATALASGKESFGPLYDVTISHPTVSRIRSIQAPYVLIRQSVVTYLTKGS